MPVRLVKKSGGLLLAGGVLVGMVGLGFVRSPGFLFEKKAGPETELSATSTTRREEAVSPTTLVMDESEIRGFDLGKAEWELEQLLEAWSDDALSQLAPILSDGEPDLVRHLLEILETTDLESGEKGRILTEASKHPDPLVREDVVVALKEQTGEFVEPLILAALRDPADEVRIQALGVVEDQPDDVRWRLLREAVATPSEVVQLGAADMLSNEEATEVQALLLTLMESPFPSVRDLAEFEFSLVVGLDDILGRVSSDPTLLEQMPERVPEIRMEKGTEKVPQGAGTGPGE